MPDGSIDMSALADVKSLAAELKTASEAVLKARDTTQTELKNLGDLTGSTKQAVDEALVKQNELAGRIHALEDRLARRAGVSGGGAVVTKSIGQQFIDADNVKGFMSTKPRGSVRFGLKAITSVTTDTDGNGGVLIQPDRRPGILDLPQNRMTIRDLLMPGETSSNMVEYLRETAFTNNAASVAELDLKPESTMRFDMVNTPVTTIAHWFRASRQVLDDAPQLRSLIDQRLRYGLRAEEENQLLTGTGTGGDLQGILPLAAAYTAPITVPSPTTIDKIRLAILQVQNTLYPPTGIVMHPNAWAGIELSKDANGLYMFANIQGTVTPRLWGLPVVATPAIAADNVLIGAFRPGGQVFDRMDATVEVSTEDRDNFIRNAVTILGEERLAVAWYLPQAFVNLDLTP
jgi:HK97 family phage major capsid protein